MYLKYMYAFTSTCMPLLQIISEPFRFQSASFVYMKANESHPKHGAVIFRTNGKCALFKCSVLPRILGRPGGILTVIFNGVCTKPAVT